MTSQLHDDSTYINAILKYIYIYLSHALYFIIIIFYLKNVL